MVLEEVEEGVKREGGWKEEKGKSPAGALAHKPCCHAMAGCHCIGPKDRKGVEVFEDGGKGVRSTENKIEMSEVTGK